MNHGFEVEAIPIRDLLAQFWKKYAVSRLNVIISGGIYKKKHEKKIIQHPCLSNQMSGALMSNSFGSLHIRQKWGKSRVLAKNRVFRGKTGFYLPLPVKTEVYSQTREISRVWRYLGIYIYKYIIFILWLLSLFYHWNLEPTNLYLGCPNMKTSCFSANIVFSQYGWFGDFDDVCCSSQYDLISLHALCKVLARPIIQEKSRYS